MPYKDLAVRREKAKAYTKAWIERNPEKRLQITYAWRKNNSDKFAAISKRYAEKNKEKIRERMGRIDAARNQTPKRKAWRAKYNSQDIDRLRAWQRTGRINRALSKQRNGGQSTSQQWEWKLEMYGYRCAYCENILDRPEIDHVIPVSKGGSGWTSNLAPACRSCNNKKRARHWLPSKLIRFGAQLGPGQSAPRMKVSESG